MHTTSTMPAHATNAQSSRSQRQRQGRGTVVVLISLLQHISTCCNREPDQSCSMICLSRIICLPGQCFLKSIKWSEVKVPMGILRTLPTCDEERHKHAENKGKSLRYLPSHSDIEERCVDSSMRPGQGRSSIAAQLKG